jgi:molybdate transport system regulatory protein
MKGKARRRAARSAAPPTKRTLRAQIWVDTEDGPAINDAGADLLDQIEVYGSLSEAARKLRFSYRRAWLLLDGMNRRWPGPVATTATGGHRGGGAKLTELGRHVLRTYRDLQLQLEHLLDTAGDSFEPFP